MILREVLSRLIEWPDEATIFAERINGEFRPESEATVLETSESDRNRSIRDVAAERCPGKEYFLEIFVCHEVVDAWILNHPGRVPTVNQVVVNIIYYAENDAYSDSMFDAEGDTHDEG